MKEKLIQEMQMCVLCAPHFDRKEDGGVLAHEIKAHVRKEINNTELMWAPVKGHKDFSWHKL